jgi:hypothetical protein
MRDELAGLSLDTIDDVLVAHHQHHTFRQDFFPKSFIPQELSPIAHQLRVAAATKAECHKFTSVAARAQTASRNATDKVSTESRQA